MSKDKEKAPKYLSGKGTDAKKTLKYDVDQDGTVSESDIQLARSISEAEDLAAKHRAQLRMAQGTLCGMGAFTAMMFMPYVSIDRINSLSDISNLFYISGAGVVGAYMGTTAWMSRK